MFSPRSLNDMRDGINTSQTSAGTTQATAAVMLATHVVVNSVGVGSGVILPLSEPNFGFIICNASIGNGNALLVYPPVGGSLNGAAANTPFNLPAGFSAMFICQGYTNFSAMS